LKESLSKTKENYLKLAERLDFAKSIPTIVQVQEENWSLMLFWASFEKNKYVKMTIKSSHKAWIISESLFRTTFMKKV